MKTDKSEYLDFTANDIFFSPSGAQFCPKTGFVFIPTDDGVGGNTANDSEFVHEQFHYISSMLTSAGFFLSCLRYARAMQIGAAILNDEPVHENLRGIDSLDERNIIRFRKTEINSLLDITNDEVSTVAYNIAILRIGELAFLHMSKIIDDLQESNLHPIGIVLQAQIAATREFCHKFGIHPDWLDDIDEHASNIAKNVSADCAIPVSAKAGRCVDTYDIFEAFSVVADLSLLLETSGLEAATARLRNVMDDPEYSIVIEVICLKLHIEFSAPKIVEYNTIFLLIIELSLDTENTTFTSSIADGLAWHDIYPPAKLMRILDFLSQLNFKNMKIGLSELAAMRVALKEQFHNASYSIAIPRRPSFFEIIQKTDPDTMEYKSDGPAPDRPIDVMDYFCDVFFSFKEYEQEKDIEGISILFGTGDLIKFKYISPPIVFKEGEILFAKGMLGSSFLNRMYSIFININAMDDYMFNAEKVRIFPFDHLEDYHSGPLYEMLIVLFLNDLELMKKEHSNST